MKEVAKYQCEYCHTEYREKNKCEECEKFDTIDKIKQELERLNLPVDTNDYFIKKAEVELKKVL